MQVKEDSHETNNINGPTKIAKTQLMQTKKLIGSN